MPQNSVPVDGSAVRKRRKATFATQGEFAKAVGIHPNTVSMIENDPDYQCSFSTIRSLATHLGCLPEDLLLKEEQSA